MLALCYRLTSDLDAAEDLAQETMYEALRSFHALHDPAALERWLSGIARNVCLRWSRSRARELARSAPSEGGLPDRAEDDYDLDVELERRELVKLLDRALALLPPDTREVLIERYVRESPYSEIAERLGLSEDAVAKRLERGRLRLKRVLSTELVRDAAPLGLVVGDPDGWERTDLWCPCCGERRLWGRFTPERELWLYCMPCGKVPVNQLSRGGSARLFRGIKGYRAASLRMIEAEERLAREGIGPRAKRCPGCGALVPLVIGFDTFMTGMHYAEAYCERCDLFLDHFTSYWVAQVTPEGRRFWREHTRHLMLPERQVEAEGVPALVVGLRSLESDARFEAVIERGTFRALSTHVTG